MWVHLTRFTKCWQKYCCASERATRGAIERVVQTEGSLTKSSLLIIVWTATGRASGPISYIRSQSSTAGTADRKLYGASRKPLLLRTQPSGKHCTHNWRKTVRFKEPGVNELRQKRKTSTQRNRRHPLAPLASRLGSFWQAKYSSGVFWYSGTPSGLKLQVQHTQAQGALSFVCMLKFTQELCLRNKSRALTQTLSFLLALQPVFYTPKMQGITLQNVL